MRQFRPAALLALTTAEGLDARAPGVTVLFLFRPNECPKLMSVLDLLNRIDPAEARIVGALTVEEYRFPAWRELLRAQEIRFPVVRLNPLRVRAALTAVGYTGGPLVLVFDASGRLVHATDQLTDRGFPALLAQVLAAHRPAPLLRIAAQ